MTIEMNIHALTTRFLATFQAIGTKLVISLDARFAALRAALPSETACQCWCTCANWGSDDKRVTGRGEMRTYGAILVHSPRRSCARGWCATFGEEACTDFRS